jgi:O-antigen/teichoic acid export membrane protein
MAIGSLLKLVAGDQKLRSLYRGSFFIMSASFLTNGAGFVFWIIATGVYSNEEIGFATAMISVMNLATVLSRLGLEQSVIRFMPVRDRSSVFFTTLVLTTVASLVLGLGLLASVDLWSPQLSFIKQPEIMMMFLLFLTANSVTSVTGTSFIALRRSDHYLLQSALITSRLIFIAPLAFLGYRGIFIAFGLSLIASAIVSMYALSRLGVHVRGFDKGFLKESFHFSMGNYLVGFLTAAPVQLVPIMVLNLLGAEATAQYYITYAIVSVLFLVPGAISTAFFVEGSYGEAVQKNAKKSLSASFFILSIALLILYLVGANFLGLLGAFYLAGFDLLRLMAPSSLFVAVVSIYFSAMKIRMRIDIVIWYSCLFFLFMMGFSYFFLTWFGLIGIGFSWLLSYGLLALLAGVMIRVRGWS